MDTTKQTEPTDRMSGGETFDRAEFLKLRSLIQQETDVHEVLALSLILPEGRWLYLIKTPFATWPKYVVGMTDPENQNPSILFRCGHEENARAAFNKLNEGEHQ